MNRVWIAAALLVAVIGLSGGALWLQHTVTTHLTAECDDLIEMYNQGDVEACRQAASELSDRFEEDMRWFPFFLKHERMDELFQNVGALPYLVSDDDPADFFATLTAIKVQLETLMDNEWPTPENIM